MLNFVFLSFFVSNNTNYLLNLVFLASVLCSGEMQGLLLFQLLLSPTFASSSLIRLAPVDAVLSSVYRGYQVYQVQAYLIFVISFTQAKFSENKIFTEKRVNYKNGVRDKIA